MVTIEFVFNIAITTLYALVALLALIYSLPILYHRRFQHRNNLFTSNFCLTTTFSCLWWIPTAISTLCGYSWEFLSAERPWLYILQSISDTAIPYSLVLVSFHRCCSIVYSHKSFFRSNRWLVVCFVGQWVVATLLSIPDIIHSKQVGLFVQ